LKNERGEVAWTIETGTGHSRKYKYHFIKTMTVRQMETTQIVLFVMAAATQSSMVATHATPLTVSA